MQLYDYFRLSAVQSAQVEKWVIKEVKGAKFQLWAEYTFAFDGREYKEKALLTSSPLPNKFLAEDFLIRSKDELTIFLDPTCPHINSFKREFPLKAALYLLVCLGTLIYFLFLKGYAAKFQES